MLRDVCVLVFKTKRPTVVLRYVKRKAQHESFRCRLYLNVYNNCHCLGVPFFKILSREDPWKAHSIPNKQNQLLAVDQPSIEALPYAMISAARHSSDLNRTRTRIVTLQKCPQRRSTLQQAIPQTAKQ